MSALADNPTAIAAGTTGAPVVEVAWHSLETQQPTSDVATITMAATSENYRALRVVVYGQTTVADTVTVEAEYNGSWQAVATATTAGGGDAFGIDVTILEADNGDSGDLIAFSGVSFVDNNSLDRTRNTISYTPTPFMGYGARASAVTGLRISAAVGALEGTNADQRTIARFYGVKRTQP
jgi:hypothetical protein